MERGTTRSHSFVVRIWREGDASDWRGWVQHASTGEETYMRDLNELLVFIEQRTGRLTNPPSDSNVPAAHLK